MIIIKTIILMNRSVPDILNLINRTADSKGMEHD